MSCEEGLSFVSAPSLDDGGAVEEIRRSAFSPIPGMGRNGPYSPVPPRIERSSPYSPVPGIGRNSPYSHQYLPVPGIGRTPQRSSPSPIHSVLSSESRSSTSSPLINLDAIKSRINGNNGTWNNNSFTPLSPAPAAPKQSRPRRTVSFGSDFMSSLAAPIPIGRARALSPDRRPPHHNCNATSTSSWFEDFAVIESGSGCGSASDVQSPAAAAAAPYHPPVSLPLSYLQSVCLCLSFLHLLLCCICLSVSLISVWCGYLCMSSFVCLYACCDGWPAIRAYYFISHQLLAFLSPSSVLCLFLYLFIPNFFP